MPDKEGESLGGNSSDIQRRKSNWGQARYENTSRLLEALTKMFLITLPWGSNGLTDVLFFFFLDD